MQRTCMFVSLINTFHLQQFCGHFQLMEWTFNGCMQNECTRHCNGLNRDVLHASAWCKRSPVAIVLVRSFHFLLNQYLILYLPRLLQCSTYFSFMSNYWALYLNSLLFNPNNTHYNSHTHYATLKSHQCIM